MKEQQKVSLESDVLFNLAVSRFQEEEVSRSRESGVTRRKLEGVDIEEYKKSQLTCPFCHCDDWLMLDRCRWSVVEPDIFPELRIVCQCSECEKEWYEIFTFKGLEAKGE